MKKLVLIGGGHAHLFVLKQLSEQKLVDVEITLITPEPFQIYSGMLPGWMAGHYPLENIQIDLRPWVKAVDAHLILDVIVGIDAEKRCVRLSNGHVVHYDLLSLDTGSETNISGLRLLGKRLLPVKPLSHFIELWSDLLADIQHKNDYVLVVIGGGAASVELVLAAQFSIQKINTQVRVCLVFPETGLLTAHPAQVRHRVVQRLQRAGVQLIAHRACGTEQGVLLSTGKTLVADVVIAATGAQQADWLATSGLKLGNDGFIAVDAFQRSVSHTNVFATGDVCSRQDISVTRSGVHAVHAGPVLANNLLAALSHRAMQSYQPRRSPLYLISCGEQYAVASWGQFSYQGYWVWRWKDYIDRGFIQRFNLRLKESEGSL
jgi:pyridine nucleotide-disulfide oxidoreductase family protein